MYQRSELNLDRAKTKKFSDEFRKNVEVFIHKKYRHFVVYVNGKYFTEYQKNKPINKAHLAQSMRFYGRIGEMHKLVNDNKRKGTAEREAYSRTQMKNVGREIAKDFVEIGLKGRVTVN